MEKAIRFSNKDGLNLTGILHQPETETKKTGILFVHAGVQGRHGNINQYVYYARQFCKEGYPCLRFDSYGLGDSEGIIPQMDMRDFYGSIQTGRYVNDTLSAIDEFLKFGVRNVILLGLCGGGITALLTGSFSKNVVGMVLMSTPTILDSSKIDYDIRIPKDIASTHLSGYVRKLSNPKYWLRFITFKSNYRDIWGYLKAYFRKSKPPVERADKRIGKPETNKLFFEAYKSCSSRIEILWFYGSNDSFWFDFKNEVYDRGFLKSGNKLVLIENANHMFTLIEWQKMVLTKSMKWLKQEFKS